MSFVAVPASEASRSTGEMGTLNVKVYGAGYFAYHVAPDAERIGDRVLRFMESSDDSSYVFVFFGMSIILVLSMSQVARDIMRRSLGKRSSCMRFDRKPT